MKRFKIAGLCLVALAAMAMATAAAASAAPVWEQLEGSTWKEVKNTEKVTLAGSLRLADTNVLLTGTVAVQCTDTATGYAGPGKFDRITEIPTASIKCVAGENCEKFEKAEARNLPWQTELTEESGLVRDVITAVTPGAGKEPGWSVECRVKNIKKADVCESESGSPGTTSMTNNTSNNTVNGAFDAKTPKAKCSVGGAKSGEVRGPFTITENETPFTGIRVS